MKHHVFVLLSACCATAVAGCGGSASSPNPPATGGVASACMTPQALNSKTWYVSASATASGTGTRQSPFNSLAMAQAASGVGDAIVVLASPTGTAPLNGGIVLKAGQQLVGDGPPVLSSGAPAMTGSLPLVGASGAASLPTITNTTSTNNGDAVELATGSAVYNVVIAGASRGGIYGQNVSGVCIQGNDVSGANTSQQAGFMVLPFYLESYTAGTANHVSLKAGWAAIMVDESAGTDSVAVDGNYVHDGSCSDGIDIRAMGSATATATVSGNFVTRLPQCKAVQTMEGIGTQANDNSTLNANLFGNTEENNGSAGANADSVFINEGGSGQLVENIVYNYYNTGIGGVSTNGMEFIVGDGTNEVGTVTIANSTFINDPGDMLEEYNRGTGSITTLVLNNVTVQGTTISGGLPKYANPPGTATTPDNTGECLGIASVGAGDQTILKMNGTVLQNCGNNGIEITNNHPTAQGAGDPSLVSVDLENSAIMNTKYYGVWMNTVTPLQSLQVKSQNTLFTTSTNGVMLGFDDQTTGGTATPAIDLGGGSLGSGGNNCILQGALLDLEATSYNVSATTDWWGSPSGPAPGTVSVSPSGYAATTSSPLTAEPSFCSSPI